MEVIEYGKTLKQESIFNLAKRILLFSIPLMLSGFLQLFYNAADLIVVGQFSGEYSDLSLAGVGATSSLISLIFNLFFGLSIGANIVMSNCYGAKNEEKAQSEEEAKEEIWLIRERNWAHTEFRRSFTLPKDIDPAKVSANFKNGVLSITIGRKEETQEQKIKIIAA